MLTVSQQQSAFAESFWAVLPANIPDAPAPFAASIFRALMRPLLPAPVVIGTAADATARDLGFTRAVYIEGGMMGGEFLIAPDTDLDDRFKAWGVDWQEWSWVNGWNVLIQEEA